MNANDYPHLAQFFGGWFHQDWMDDGYATPADVVRDYIKCETPEMVHETYRELSELLSGRLTPNQMTKLIGDALGCAYDPAADGKSWRSWLREIEKLMRPTQAKR